MFSTEHISFSWIEFSFFSVFREKERIKIFFFSQNVPKISGTANGSEDLSLYLIHVHFVLFPVMCIFATDHIFFYSFPVQELSKLKELFPTEDEADLDTVLKCSFNLEHAIDTQQKCW